jgi:peptide/nickel transport system permease protein
MLNYLIKRVAFSFIVFMFIALVAFIMVWLIPGDFYTPLDFYVSVFGLDPEIPAMLRAQTALDKPMLVQFWIWFTGVILHGDFGVSFATKGPVGPFLFRRGGPAEISLLVSGTSLLMAWLIGIPAGIFSSYFRGKGSRITFYMLTVPWLSIPSYVLGTMLQWFIYRFIDPLMVGSGLWGICGWRYIGLPMSCAKFGSCILHLTPLWIIVGMPILITVMRYVRASMEDVMQQNYIVVAKAKGMSELRLLFKHAMRNAVNPLISSFGVMLPMLLMNTIIVARLFNIPSFAQFLLEWVEYQDQHVVTAALLFYGSFMIVGNLVADVLLAITDPRIRYH